MRKLTEKFKVGQKFNKFTILEFNGKHKSGHLTALCKCDCGNIRTISLSDLKLNRSKSCGCIRKEAKQLFKKDHGMTNTKEFKTWAGIKIRCYNKNYKSYNYYGGKGVTMCNRWLNSFRNFLEDMGFAPTNKHSIDRIDSNGNYEPNNCKWSTLIEQANNKSNNKFYEYNGEIKSVPYFSRKYNIPMGRLYERLKAGYSIKDAIEQPKYFKVCEVYKLA